ncbi:MAG: hypothetical protein OES26_12040 [Gammaproteobacteria bacterium]|nr:hypothetical protein [Gammaproteobacteria bacterium]
MSVFTLHLVDRIGSVSRTSEIAFWNAAMRSMIQNELQQLFNRVVNDPRARPVSSARVLWTNHSGGVGPADLVVYFSTDRAHGVTQRVAAQAAQHSHTGQTLLGDSAGIVSEVYVSGHLQVGGFDSLGTRQKASLFAKGAFHECMHNKLYPLNIHTGGGGGLASATLSYDFGLVARNIDLMAPALQVAAPQNTAHMGRR